MAAAHWAHDANALDDDVTHDCRLAAQCHHAVAQAEAAILDPDVLHRWAVSILQARTPLEPLSAMQSSSTEMKQPRIVTY